MIPKRIKLASFLCYQDEQEICFDGSSLWMLSGLNGSGKSSVFDAVTYALFGHHRGGSQGAVELINKNGSGFSIEFEFELDAESYQIRRTLKRRGTTTTATQQVLRGAHGGKFEPIQDTHRKTEFDLWVRDHVGLNFETFTSSVLLLQGRAEKLLDSTAKGRAEVLASIVNLERYRKLHEKADGKRKGIRGQVETLQSQFAAVPEVTELELLSTANRTADAMEDLNDAQADLDRLQTIAFRAKQWAEIQSKISVARSRRLAAATLIREAATIERELARLKELRDALPHVETIFQRRADLVQSEERTKDFADGLRQLESQLAEVEHAIEQAKLKKTAASAANRRRRAEAPADFEIATGSFGPSRANEAGRSPPRGTVQTGIGVGRISDRSHSSNRRCTTIDRRIDRLAASIAAFNPADAIARGIEADPNSIGPVATGRSRNQIPRRGHPGRSRIDQAAFGRNSDARKQADDRLISETALLRQAIEMLAEFDQLDGAKTCRTCGQELTVAHFRDEKARRQKERKAHESQVKALETEARSARDSEKDLSDEAQNVDRQLETAREEFRDIRNHVQQGVRDVARLRQECDREYTALVEPVRIRLAPEQPTDWASVQVPSQAELDGMRRQLTGLTIARRDLEHAREAITRRRSLEAQIAAAGQALADLSATVPEKAHDLAANSRVSMRKANRSRPSCRPLARKNARCKWKSTD